MRLCVLPLVVPLITAHTCSSSVPPMTLFPRLTNDAHPIPGPGVVAQNGAGSPAAGWSENNMQRQSTAMTESRAGLIRSSRAFESAKRNASGVLFEPCPPSGGTCGSGFRSSGPADLRLGRGGGRSGTCPSAGRTFRFAKEKPHHNNNNHWQHRYEERDDVLAGRPGKELPVQWVRVQPERKRLH